MTFALISLILLLLVVLDATGDALRSRGKQLLHHSIESIQIAIWIALWALFEFHWLYVLMYIFARFVFFDLIYNLIVGNKWYYVGVSSIYDRVFRAIGKTQGAIMAVTVPKFIIFVWWTAWLLTNANGKF